MDASATGLDLTGTDCSDGLARCTGGQVMVSRAAHVPSPCGGRGERGPACACPWDVRGRCASGCAVEGLEAIASPDAAMAQLCRAREPVARPRAPTDPPASVCARTGVACVDGIVVACAAIGRPAETLGVCLYGCESGVGLPDDVSPGAPAIADGAAAILCRRSHAERQ